MTKNNLKIVIFNSYCCIATKAIELSDLISKGNRCSFKQMMDLKINVDRINVLSEYFCSLGDSTDFIDNNGLTDEEADEMVHELMDYCEICDCQLSL